eukprot:447653-Prorocentrum_minimum.AAC.1
MGSHSRRHLMAQVVAIGKPNRNSSVYNAPTPSEIRDPQSEEPPETTGDPGSPDRPAGGGDDGPGAAAGPRSWQQGESCAAPLADAFHNKTRQKSRLGLAPGEAASTEQSLEALGSPTRVARYQQRHNRRVPRESSMEEVCVDLGEGESEAGSRISTVERVSTIEQVSTTESSSGRPEGERSPRASEVQPSGK